MLNTGTRKEFKYSFILEYSLPPDKTRANQFHTELGAVHVFNQNEWGIKRLFNKKDSLRMQFRSAASHIIRGGLTTSVHHTESFPHQWSIPHTSQVCVAISTLFFLISNTYYCKYAAASRHNLIQKHTCICKVTTWIILHSWTAEGERKKLCA